MLKVRPSAVRARKLDDVARERATGSGTADTDAQSAGKADRWYQRPTVRALKKQAENEAREFTRVEDERENDENRLPMSEAVHLGGLVLTEAFTPSTVSLLYKTLERWPSDHGARKQEWLEQLASSRGGSRGGWQSLGVVRPPGALVLPFGYHDPDLPSGVNAVWLHLSYVTPALAMVVATFTLAENAGDLSDLLRRDYRTKHFDTYVRVHGRLGAQRAHIPWSRPARHGIGYSVSRAEDEKRRACQALVREHEDACSSWFFARFRGRFATARPEDRPVIRLLFTQEEVPYAERRAWLRPIGLDFALPLWRSTDVEGWWLSQERWPYREGRHVMTLAAKRAAVGGDPSEGEGGESNRYLTQRFDADQAPLAARHAVTALLAIYSERLGDLRDKAGVRRFPSRPVRAARILDDYLLRDGLDSATITSDLVSLTQDLAMFRWGVPEFIEHRGHLRQAASKRPLLEYVPSLRDWIREQAVRLASDTKTTTGNIRASAELRQAIANTRLQRFILALAAIAAILAVISLVTQG